MKKLIYLCVISLCAASCNYLDITPKGATYLDNLRDLELLLNNDYQNSAYTYDNLTVITNESYGRGTKPAVTIANGPTTLLFAYLTYDETVDRYALTPSDANYSRLYSNTNYANVLLSKIDGVAGDQKKKDELKAEARVMRAYFHYIMVNLYAKQYDPATAVELGGIPYVTTTNVAVQNTKQTIAVVYEKLLADCSNEVIAALPDEAANQSRPGKAMGYAVRAKILLQMKNYADALIYANKALERNGTIEDRIPIIVSKTYIRTQLSPGNIFWSGMGSGHPNTALMSKECGELFEAGDILFNYAVYGTTPKPIWNAENGLTDTGMAGVYKLTNGANYQGPVGGITSDQMYFIKAECLIRSGSQGIAQGMAEINKVREKRIDPSVYQPLTAVTEADAMRHLMRVKKIECFFSYNTFFDTKRWNSEQAYKSNIVKELYGKTYTLTPDSPLWVMPFPAEAVQFNSSLTQNY